MRKDYFKEELGKIVMGDYVNEYEIVSDFAIALSLCLIKKMEVYVYGAGTDSYSFIKFLKMQEIKVWNVLDEDINKSGKYICESPVIHPSELKNVVKHPDNAFVFIHTSYFKGLVQQEIIQYLSEAGIHQFYALSKEDRYVVTSNTSYWVDSEREVYYQNNLGKLFETLDLLSDETSCQVMNEYIRSYAQKDVYKLEQLPCRYKYFYDYDKRARKVRSIYHFDETGVWLNCGAHEGDTVFYFFAAGLKMKEILAVEGDEKIAKSLRKNIERLPEELQCKVRVETLYIGANTDFEKLLRGEKLSLLNADIEGAELEMLKSMKHVFQKDRPVISVCVYHKREDLIAIPQYLNSIVDDYRFYLRKYGAHYGNENRNKELVLYAVPNEKAVNEL